MKCQMESTLQQCSVNFWVPLATEDPGTLPCLSGSFVIEVLEGKAEVRRPERDRCGGIAYVSVLQRSQFP